jgi:4-hydroxy-tetrahydrodipicolinate synthase
MTQPPFTGVGVALVTLFEESGAVHDRATADLAARLVELGVRAVVVAGSTGEAATLDAAERRTLLAAVRSAVPAATPVIAGVGAPTGRQAAAFTTDAIAAGADAVLALSPPRVPDPRSYYETLAKAAGDVPLLAYHFPAVSSPGIDVDLLPELPIAGIKDSSADPERLLVELDRLDGAIYVGSSVMLSMAGAVGAHGAILTLANCVPELCIAAYGGDPLAQRELLATHLRGSRNFPAGIKSLVAERFGTPTTARLGT